MKILFLANWKIEYLDKNSDAIQPANKVVNGEKFWFFKSWPQASKIDVLDFSTIYGLNTIERSVTKVHIIQGLKAFFRQNKYDLIISHGAPSGLVLSLLNVLLGKNKPPHILIDVGCFNGGRNNEFETGLIKFTFKNLAKLIYHAKIQKKYYEEHFSHQDSFYVPFGVDLDYFYPLDEPVEDYVITFGYRKRDYPTLLKAWNSISTGTKLKIVGLSNEQMQDIKKIAPNSNVDLVSVTPTQDLKKMIARSRFVIVPLPYFKYAYGQKTFLEPMAMKKAVIVTKTPSSEDYVTDLETAVLVKPYDDADMKKKIELLLSDEGLVEKISNNALRSVQESFTVKQMAERIYEIANHQ